MILAVLGRRGEAAHERDKQRRRAIGVGRTLRDQILAVGAA
jgi:hypothetical protein